MRWAIAVFLLVAIGAHAGLQTRLYAHEKFKIVGTVVSLKSDEVAVKAIDGATYEIDLLENTVVTDRHHKRLARTALKTGLRVVVLALGHDMFDLEAYEVQLVER
jgi:hypothetical protein